MHADLDGKTPTRQDLGTALDTLAPGRA